MWFLILCNLDNKTERVLGMATTYDDTMFRETFEHEFTWLNGFLRNARRFSNRSALIDPVCDKSWTYSELNKISNQFANALYLDGIRKDDVIMGALINCPAFVFCYVGPRKIGAIFNPVNPSLPAAEVALLIDFNRPKVLIYSMNSAKIITKALALSKYPPSRVMLADNLKNIKIPEGHVSFEEYIENKSMLNPVMDFKPHIYDEVLRMCTSGTTALPKSVPINDINDVMTAHNVALVNKIDRTSVTLNLTPWFHRGGAHMGGICPTLYMGGTIVVMRNFSPLVTLKWVHKYGITHMTGAPISFEMLTRVQELNNIDVSSLECIVSMGAPLDQELCKRFMKYLCKNVMNGYGTTETLANCYLHQDALPQNAGSVGEACIDDDVRVIKVYPDHKGTPDEMVANDGKTVGEVVIWAPSVSTYSYYNAPELEKEKYVDGWAYTGDLATWDENYYITINSRKDDMIICSGENIYPTQIEEVIDSFDKVDDSMVTSISDKVRGQEVVAYIKAKEPTLTEKEVAMFCRKSDKLSSFKCPRWYRIVNDLPRTATGKKQHHIMKKQAEDDFKNGLLVRG